MRDQLSGPDMNSLDRASVGDVACGQGVGGRRGSLTGPRRGAVLSGELVGERQESDAEDSQIGLDGTRADRVPFGE